MARNSLTSTHPAPPVKPPSPKNAQPHQQKVAKKTFRKILKTSEIDAKKDARRSKKAAEAKPCAGTRQPVRGHHPGASLACRGRALGEAGRAQRRGVRVAASTWLRGHAGWSPCKYSRTYPM